MDADIRPDFQCFVSDLAYAAAVIVDEDGGGEGWEEG